MLNHVWAFLVIIGLFTGFGTALYNAESGTKTTKVVDGKTITEVHVYHAFHEKMDAVGKAGNALGKAVFDMVGFQYTDDAGKTRSGAVGIAVDYIGLIAFWLGLMKLAEAAGLISILSRLIAPLFRFIFPTIPKDHPAAGAILLNFAANILGLDNAATPLGINAMQELQKLNGEKDTASNAMCMFLSLNVSSLTLIPASVIALRASTGSREPASFMPVMFVATFTGTLTAFILCKIAEKVSRDTRPATESAVGDDGSEEEVQ